MTKPIIVVKVPCKLLYVIQVKEFLIKCLTSWPYLISYKIRMKFIIMVTVSTKALHIYVFYTNAYKSKSNTNFNVLTEF